MHLVMKTFEITYLCIYSMYLQQE